jgi:thioesterase domain-containing protein
LFCVHPVGGNVFCYLDLARSLGGEQPVYGLQAPAPGACLSIVELADLYLDALREAQPSGPYRLAGWSFGGVVAFEIARRLGPEEVELLVLLDPSTPEGWRALGGLDPAALVEIFARDLAALTGARLPAGDLQGLDIDGALRRVLAQAHEHGVLPGGFDLVRLGEYFAMFRNNIQAMARYAPDPYPGHLVLIQAEERPEGEGEEPAAAWRRLAASVAVQRVPGSHYTLLSQPGVHQVCDLLEPLLRTAEGE